MRRTSLGVGLFVGLGGALAFASVPACSGAGSPSFFADGGTGNANGNGGSGTGGTGSGTLGSGTGGTLGSGNGGSGTGSSGSGGGTGGVTCPTGLQCNVSCSSGKTTTVSGKVYDPAGKNGLYGVAVYVPAAPLQPLPKGVPTGADACSCGALYQSGAVTNATTDVNGAFTLQNVPVGSDVPLVLQIGKWRKSLKINVTSCQDNPQADKTLKLPGTVAAGDTDDNMPDLAVSTGSADSLECLLLRIGVSSSEYVAGTSTAGHVHIFSGGSSGGGGGGGGGAGRAESTPMAGAPASPTSLWASQAQLMPYDVVLLSCEGGETYNANPPALESYLNAGGRAFGSHFHYAWFSGPLGSNQSYAAPTDWGSNLATWSSGSNGGGGFGGGAPIGGVIDLTLNGSNAPFPKGATLHTWLAANGALGGLVPSTELAIYQPKYNAVVGPANKPSQPWITSDSSSGSPNQTMYFSFDTPVNATTPPGATSPAYCGRAVFSDLHVAGAPTTTDSKSQPPPASCANVDLSAQEKALEFMLFDLSSCVVADTVAVPQDAGLPPPPAK